MRIYVDIDDVLCETAVGLCEIAAREFGRRVEYGNVRDFDLQKVFSLSDAEMARFRELSHLAETLASFAITPGAVEGVRALVAAGHEVDLVTGRPASSHIGTETWLESAGLSALPVLYVDKYDRAGIFSHAADDPPTVSMAELESRGYGVAIDDSPLALAKLARWERTEVLVFDRPWNAAFHLAPNMERIRSWPDAVSGLRGSRGMYDAVAVLPCGAAI